MAILRRMGSLLRRDGARQRPDHRDEHLKFHGVRTEILADQLPWFGEAPFEPARETRVPRGAVNDLPYVRRILLSWLLGRPVSEVARRAGCSPRLVHKVFRQIFAVPEPRLGLEKWLELGLVIVPGVKSPSPPGPTRERPSSTNRETLVPVYCGVCHRLLGGYEVFEDCPDGALLSAEDLDWNQDRSGWGSDGLEIAVLIQGHLINHFRLRFDPIRMPDADPLDEIKELISPPEIAEPARRRIEGREVILRRRSWMNLISGEALREADQKRSRSMLPVREGREVTAGAARAMWRQALAGKSTASEPLELEPFDPKSPRSGA